MTKRTFLVTGASKGIGRALSARSPPTVITLSASLVAMIQRTSLA
ncbi:hypothetical protein [Mesorhizobium sp. B1-1-1]|nr:hypothetical protein [Mesorhizobium sp. B1-1-1]